MAVLTANVLTLIDWAKRLDPDGKVPSIVELLNQSNEILLDMKWKEGNLPTGHRTTVRTGLPSSFWRLLNAGVQPSKSTTAQIDEGCGMLEAWSEVDKDLAELNGNTSQFRLSEAMAFIEGMNQTMATAMFYGNTSVTPEQFNGLSIRYSALAGGTGQNIINAAGVGSDNTSVWLVGWGDQSIYGIFPKGSKAGLVHDDLGEGVIESVAGIGGSRMMGYRDRWQWKAGIALRDWRYVVRIANIDVSNLVTKSSAADLSELMIRSIHRLPFRKLVNPVFYMNRTVFEMLDIQRRDDVQSGGQLKYEQVDGVMTPTFRGYPIRIVDALTLAETVVS